MESTTLASRRRLAKSPVSPSVAYDRVMKQAYDRAMQKDSYTLDEAYELIMREIKAIYDGTPNL